MSKLHNVFAFSFSKLDSFRKCARAHYIGTYAQWYGWEYNATPLQKSAYRLKKLSGLAAWMGDIVHREIANTMKDALEGQTFSAEKSIERMKAVFGSEFKISEARASNPNMPAKTFGLKEHEYKEEITKEKKAETWEKAKAAMIVFHASGVIARVIKAGKKNMLSIDNLSTFPVQSADGIDVPVYSVPDLAFREDDNVVIYDWKTGKEKAEYDDQVAMYSLHAHAMWGIAPTKVEANIFYLATNNNISKISTQAWIDSAKAKIQTGVEEMRDMLVGRNMANNTPLKAKEFKLTTSEWACKYCNFERICGIKDIRAGRPDPLEV